MFRFNSRDTYFKTPFGAVSNDTKVTFRLKARDGIYVNGVHLVACIDDGEEVYYPMKYTGKKGEWSIFACTVTFDKAGLYWYHFQADTEFGPCDLFRGEHGNISSHGGSYQLTVYDKDYTTPKDIKGGIIYHIFVDRFNKGADKDSVWCKSGVLKNWDEPVTIVDSDGVFRANDFYGGNLQGIIDKLDYLKSLGVTTIYLSPIFKSGSNHRYDTGNYMEIDELLGSEESFKRLVKEAKAKGIGIILDGVFNHTGSDSMYFNKLGTYPTLGAYQSKRSPYYDWYYFNNFPDEYACWWGITVTPTVNKTSSTYRQYILGNQGVLDKWTKTGIQGWRLDVVDELDIDFVNGIRETVKSVDKNAVVIGEVWEDASNKIAYSKRRPYFQGKQLDGVMNYPFKEAVLAFVRDYNANHFVERVMSIYENYPLMSLNCCMNFLGTHDTVRAINSLCDRNINGTSKYDRLHIKLEKSERSVAVGRLKLATVLQYILPGIPSIYYGDEIGLEGYEDPINRKPFPWDDMDEDILKHYRLLGKMRTDYKDAFVGEMKVSYDGALLTIEREGKKENIRVVVNCSYYECDLPVADRQNMAILTHGVKDNCIKKHGYAVFFA